MSIWAERTSQSRGLRNDRTRTYDQTFEEILNLDGYLFAVPDELVMLDMHIQRRFTNRMDILVDSD